MCIRDRSMLELLEKMTINPARLYHMPYGTISEGAAADFVIFDPDEKWVPCESVSYTHLDVYKRQHMWCDCIQYQ